MELLITSVQPIIKGGIAEINPDPSPDAAYWPQEDLTLMLWSIVAQQYKHVLDSSCCQGACCPEWEANAKSVGRRV